MVSDWVGAAGQEAGSAKGLPGVHTCGSRGLLVGSLRDDATAPAGPDTGGEGISQRMQHRAPGCSWTRHKGLSRTPGHRNGARWTISGLRSEHGHRFGALAEDRGRYRGGRYHRVSPAGSEVKIPLPLAPVAGLRGRNPIRHVLAAPPPLPSPLPSRQPIIHSGTARKARRRHTHLAAVSRRTAASFRAQMSSRPPPSLLYPALSAVAYLHTAAVCRAVQVPRSATRLPCRPRPSRDPATPRPGLPWTGRHDQPYKTVKGLSPWHLCCRAHRNACPYRMRPRPSSEALMLLRGTCGGGRVRRSRRKAPPLGSSPYLERDGDTGSRQRQGRVWGGSAPVRNEDFGREVHIDLVEGAVPVCRSTAAGVRRVSVGLLVSGGSICCKGRQRE